MTEIDLERVLAEIKEKDLVGRLRLVTGNCGVFAIALKRLLQKGELYNIGNGAHVLLKLVRNSYVDGVGIHTGNELRKIWGRWGSGKIDNDEDVIIKQTANSYSIEEMEEIIVCLSKGLEIPSEKMIYF